MLDNSQSASNQRQGQPAHNQRGATVHTVKTALAARKEAQRIINLLKHYHKCGEALEICKLLRSDMTELGSRLTAHLTRHAIGSHDAVLEVVDDMQGTIALAKRQFQLD